jgi:hypothetical protein
MHISTNKVSPVMLRPKKFEILRKKICENCKRAEKTQTECHEIEPNPAKDRTMHVEDNPLIEMKL